jgi:hypothetical protein
MWCVEIGDAPITAVSLGRALTTGGLDSYSACQAEARRLRRRGARRLRAPSAAMKPGAARGTTVRGGPRAAPPRDGVVIVVFGPPEALVGWVAADGARPPDDLLDRVRHYPSR